MLRNWVALGGLLVLTLCTAGCRKTMPDIKPGPEAEVLRGPPMDSRFSRNEYPKQAFADRESNLMRKTDMDLRPTTTGMMPTAGGGLGGPGGFGGSGGLGPGIR